MFFKVIVLIILNVGPYNSKSTQSYQVTPSLPPKAFVGQYYTCDFRVQGLINPFYKFTNLPSFLKSSQNGRIQGSPTKKGTYKFIISYAQTKKLGQSELLLSVSDPQMPVLKQNTKQKQFLSNTKNFTSSSLPLTYAQFPSIYTVGDDIFLNLPQLFSFPTKIWSYLSLPSQLVGQDNGYISGSFYNQGMYSFVAIHSDENGKTKSFVITLNIQPVFYYDFWGGYDLEIVPVRDSCKCYSKAFQTRKMALSLLAQSQKSVITLQQKVNQLKDLLTKQFLLITMTKSTLKTQSEIKLLTFAKQSQLVKKQQSTKEYLNKAKSNNELAHINLNNSKYNLQKMFEKSNQAEQYFKKSKNFLQDANKLFIEAQSASFSAASQMGPLQAKISGYKDDIQALFQVFATAKQTLLNYQNNFIKNSFISSNSQNAKQIANMENDIALSDLNKKEAILNKTLLHLNQANQNASDLRESLNQASINLGAAKFDLNQSMNQLLVAQATKAMADKNLAIISSQLSKSSNEGKSTYVFEGCDQRLYPSFSGTSSVTDLLSFGALLASGHILLIGNCSKKVQITKGDVISLDGYLKDGVIHALSITKS